MAGVLVSYADDVTALLGPSGALPFALPEYDQAVAAMLGYTRAPGETDAEFIARLNASMSLRAPLVWGWAVFDFPFPRIGEFEVLVWETEPWRGYA